LTKRPRSSGSLSDEPAATVRAAYGASTNDRLVALKDGYDPTNFFRFNQNTTPSLAKG
jgi:Berberine and berberine like